MEADAPGYREREYSFLVQVAGKRYLRNLRTNDKNQAQANARAIAREIKDAVARGQLDRLRGTKQRQPIAATLAQILAAYKTCPVDANARTRTTNTFALLNVLTLALGQPIQEDSALPASVITAEAARQYFTAKNALILAEPDQARQTTHKRTANSRFNQARCLFTPKTLAHYKALGFYQPGMSEFADAFKLHRFRLPALDFNPPAETVIAATLAQWEKIEDRNLYLAIGHELAFGLRAGELAQAKWEWWTTRQGYPVLDGQANVKNGTGFVQVRALDPFFNQMRAKIEARHWRGQPGDYIIDGTMTLRTDAIFRAVSDWLRSQGWGTRKTNHALRAYAGSQIAMKYGIYEAQTWLRHSTVKVTETHYAHFVRKFKPADADTLPARWATLQTAPQLQILQPKVA